MNWKSIKNSRKFFHDNRKNSFPHRFTCILSIRFSSSYEPESNNGSDWILPKRMSIYVSEIHNSNSCQLWKRTMRTQTVKEFKSSYSIRTICWAHECSKEHRSHTADWVLEGASTRCDFPSFCRLNGNYLDFCVGFKTLHFVELQQAHASHRSRRAVSRKEIAEFDEFFPASLMKRRNVNLRVAMSSASDNRNISTMS